MKKIINNRLYNTETAKNLAENWYSNSTDFNHWSETLYLKRTGEYFIFGEGGPMSRYSQSTGNGWTGGWDIIPLTEQEAKEWAEKNISADEYMKIFGEVKE